MLITALTHLEQNSRHPGLSADRARKQPLGLISIASPAQATQDLCEPGLSTSWTGEHTLRQTLSACVAQSFAHHRFLRLRAGWAGEEVFLIGHRPEEEYDAQCAATLRLESHSGHQPAARHC